LSYRGKHRNYIQGLIIVNPWGKKAVGTDLKHDIYALKVMTKDDIRLLTFLL